MKLFIPLILIALLASINGCKEDAIAPQGDNVDLSIKSTRDSTDASVLQLDTVKLLISDIKLNVSNNNQDSTNFKVGPYVLYLNWAPILQVVTSTYIPPGTYDKVRFMVHKLNDNEPVPDPDFADVNGRYSVVVKGSFNDSAFVFKSDKSAHQKLTFPGSLVVSSTGYSNITLQIDPYIWFYVNGLFIDPRDPVNKVIIENNIKDNINANFKIFVDNDRNGQPD